MQVNINCSECYGAHGVIQPCASGRHNDWVVMWPPYNISLYNSTFNLPRNNCALLVPHCLALTCLYEGLYVTWREREREVRTQSRPLFEC